MLKKTKDKKGFTLAELLVVVAIIGVLVAISIPIFTSQLAKARLATNQANARAGKAAVVATLLDKNTNMDKTKLVYKYDPASGTITSDSPMAAATGTAITASDISSWSTSTTVSGTDTLGSKVYKYWYFTVNEAGDTITAINASDT
jgi:prepilin-type N-terminal cleavage/methylation domain-containing protein